MDKMLEKAAAPLVQYLLHETGSIFLVADFRGMIVVSNEFADNLTGRKLAGCHLDAIMIDFSKSFSIGDYRDSGSIKHLLNVTTASGLPETYHFSFITQGDVVLILGETDPQEYNMLRKNLLDLNKDLNNLTRELHKKNAELTRLNELKNQFMGMAAHDLRNPLAVIMGYSDFLLEDLGSELLTDQHKMLQSIRSSSKFMLNLVNDLLDVTVIEAGKLVLNRQKISPGRLLRQNVELNNSIAAKKEISINLEMEEDIPDIDADPVKFEQVLNNLLGNAIKFSPHKSVISVKLSKTDDSIDISVTDLGPGIPSTDLETVFAPFNQGHARPTGGEKSTGLGLAIVRKIIEGHGGSIRVISAERSGTTFSFSLPVST
jgi:signal transduction histidine kinase